MTRSTIHVDLPGDVAGHGEELAVNAQFDVDVHNRTAGLAVFGLIMFLVGLIGIVAATSFLIAAYPDDWNVRFEYDGQEIHNDEDFQGMIANEDEVQRVKEIVGVLGLAGAAFLFMGLAFYTYGRTYRGEDHHELAQSGVI